LTSLLVQPFGTSPACAFDQPSGSAFEPTSDSHRPSTPSALSVSNLRLAPPIHYPTLPDGSNVRHRLLHLRLCFPAILRLASSPGLSA
jgi:hypothetical protein